MLTMANKNDKIEAVTAEISKVVHDSLASILKQTFGKPSPGGPGTSSNAGTSGTSSASALEISEGTKLIFLPL